jgi:hypothetical protein
MCSFARTGSTIAAMLASSPMADDVWTILERAGVPCGAAGGTRPDLTNLPAVVAAARAAVAEPARLGERQRVSLLAWLSAWASSFPTSFRQAFGDDGAALLSAAAEQVEDVGRYLKLRRIAREQLLRVL